MSDAARTVKSGWDYIRVGRFDTFEVRQGDPREPPWAYACTTCGALVVNRATHDAWHEAA